MELSQHNALQIVKEINRVLPQKINLMDKHGIIIASSDASRIGTFHSGAAKMIAEDLDELCIHGNDVYTGARPGTNFLLCVQDMPIGVLGITGSYNEILPIARVIKKMTEMLVNEQARLKQHARLEENRTRFLREWLTHSKNAINKTFLKRGLALGIDIHRPMRCLTLQLTIKHDTVPEGIETVMQEKIYELDSQSLVCATMTETILLIPARSDESAYELALALKNTIESCRPVQIAIGIDATAPSYLCMHDAYMQARKALQSCLRTQKNSIKFYKELNIELFADEIPDAAKLQYIHKIFRDFAGNELASCISLLELFYEKNGSITQTAAHLFIHKNTLQQHLKKIAARTGYDPRSLHDAAVFYIAIYFYHDIINSGQHINIDNRK